jgi:hypothetical protein
VKHVDAVLVNDIIHDFEQIGVSVKAEQQVLRGVVFINIVRRYAPFADRNDLLGAIAPDGIILPVHQSEAYVLFADTVPEG